MVRLCSYLYLQPVKLAMRIWILHVLFGFLQLFNPSFIDRLAYDSKYCPLFVMALQPFEELVYEKAIKNRPFCYQMKAKVVFDEILD